MINGWVAAYGESNVTVRLYERGALKDGDIVSDFCEFLKPGVKDVLTERKASSNPSIAGNLLFVKRVLNCFLTKEHSLSIANEVAGLVNLDPTFKGKIPVNQRLINRIGFLSRDDRNELNDRFGLKMRPRRKPIEGPKCPDMDRLSEHLAMIRATSERKNFKLGRAFGPDAVFPGNGRS